MSFFAEAERTFSVAPEVAFDRLADGAGWSAWMPRSFRPVGELAGVLRVGDRVKVRVAGAPVATTIEISVMERGREIAWKGGVRALLGADHHFFFEDDGQGGTRVRSVEEWFGVLAPIVRFVLQRAAERIGAEQLAGLARGLEAG